MDLGELFLFASVTMSVADLVSMVWKKRRPWIGFALLSFLFALLAGSTLVWYFLTDNFQVTYVANFSSRDLDVIYKIAALWAGQPGSLLLWTFFVYLFYLSFRLSTQNRNIDGKFLRVSYGVATSMTIFFIVLTLLSAPFDRFDFIPSDGAGLNPLLQSFWMAIHPPIVFVGYAAVTIPCSIAITALLLGEHRHDEPEMFFMEITWFFLGLGILIGGLWSYEVLGWGGYWSWDPVETASLIPWLACTAYLHSKRAFGAKGYAKSNMAILTFMTILFAAWMTRSGVIQSVHAFAESPLAIAFEGSIIFLVIFAVYLNARTQAKLEPRKTGTMRPLLTFSFFLLLFLACVSTTGILYPVAYKLLTGVEVAVTATYYNLASLPMVMACMYLGIAYVLLRWIENRAIILSLLVAITVVGLTFATIGFPLPNAYANFSLPLVILATAIAMGWSAESAFTVKRKRLTLFSRRLFHVGVALLLIGVIISSTTQTVWLTPGEEHGYCIPVGGQGEIAGYQLSINEIQSSYIPTAKFIHSTKAHISVSKNGALVGGGVATLGVCRRGSWHRDPLIVRAITEDIYIVLDSIMVAENGQPMARLLTRMIPGVNLVWLGGAILTFSALPVIIDRRRKLFSSNGK